VELPPRWVKNERDFLALVKAQCAEELAEAPPFPEAYGERRLLRFLRQHKNAEKALKAVKHYLQFRKAQGLDAIREKVVETGGESRAWPHGDFFADRALQCLMRRLGARRGAPPVETMPRRASRGGVDPFTFEQNRTGWG